MRPHASTSVARGRIRPIKQASNPPRVPWSTRSTQGVQSPGRLAASDYGVSPWKVASDPVVGKTPIRRKVEQFKQPRSQLTSYLWRELGFGVVDQIENFPNGGLLRLAQPITLSTILIGKMVGNLFDGGGGVAVGCHR